MAGFVVGCFGSGRDKWALSCPEGGFDSGLSFSGSVFVLVIQIDLPRLPIWVLNNFISIRYVLVN